MCIFQKIIPESTVVKSRSGKGCYLDDSDDEEFEGFSFGDIEAAENRHNRKLKRSQRELAKLKSSDLELDKEEDETSRGQGLYPGFWWSGYSLIALRFAHLICQL